MLKRIIHRIHRETRVWFNLRRTKKLGIEFSPPNYVFKTRLGPDKIVVDVGCADDPDLSLFMMKSFGVKAFAIDPTRRHFPALAEIEASHPGQFRHLPLAVANQCGRLTFHESRENVSGSLLATHVNITNDATTSYEVEAVTIPVLRERIGAASIDFLKLDLEGIEYQLIESSSATDFDGIAQLFVEFHHHAIPEYTVADTTRLANRIAGYGFQKFSLDGHNYLFWRDTPSTN